MNRHIKKITLLIFPTSPTIINEVKNSTISLLKKNDISISQIITEKSFFSLYTKTTIKALRILSSCLGIKKIELAYYTANEDQSLLDTIIKVGQKIVFNENFYIKVFSENSNVVARDLEFVATGLLIEKLANKLSIPSNNEYNASKLIKVYIVKSHSYISFKTIKGIGGMVFGYLKKRIFIIVYDRYSLYCLKNIILSGFTPDIFILFWDYTDLKTKLYLIHNIINYTNRNKIKIQLLQINLLFSNSKDRKDNHILDYMIINICLYLTNLKYIALPYNLLVHPINLIEKSFKLCIHEGRIPWYPCLYEDNMSNIIEENFEHMNSTFINRKEYPAKFQEMINRKQRTLNLKKNIKTFYVQNKSLNIRPNYIDNILNSV
ncbi:MAG TPA: hypothetical protein VJ697_10350 [Nitrososphaeraceae archaeon]|nr:hypothetical protein [Nitrososphaeraceae archaeon]